MRFQVGDVVIHDHHPSRMMTIEHPGEDIVGVVYFVDTALCRKIFHNSRLHKVGMQEVRRRRDNLRYGR